MAGPFDMPPNDPGIMVEGPQPVSPVDMTDPSQEDVIPRDTPNPPEARKRLVKAVNDMVLQAKSHWDKDYRRMERDQRFAAGHQWPEETKSDVFNDAADDRYVANITLRLIQQRVAALYAKNPRAVARRRPKLLSTVWDGSMQTLQQAQQTLSQAMASQQVISQFEMTGVPPMDPATGAPLPPPPPVDPVAMQEAQSVVADAQKVKMQIDQLNKIGRTLELLYEYEISEQQQPFKSMMKMAVRRAATTGVGWVRIGFQRIMGKSPDFDTRIADMQQRLSTIERIAADLADDEILENDAEVEQLKLTMQELQNEEEIIVREGLQFSYPKSTAIIPDPRCVNLREFLGCDWVAEEYVLSANEIKETYGVDVGKTFTAYNRLDVGTDYERARAVWNGVTEDDARISPGDAESALVWEVYNKRDGLVYVVCDGYPQFLREPAAPDIYTDRFWPWYPIMFNEVDGKVYPPSDVQLVRSMQLELNRSRQGLREHRFANRPKMGYAEGLLSEEDLNSLRTPPQNALIAISGLQPGQAIDQVLMPIKGAPIDMNIYEVNPVFQDFLRVSGEQEANLGGTANATATETNVAQASRSSSIGSAVDDIDETLTGIAKAAGQILLLNVSEQTVKEIVGEGAIWPGFTKAEVARDLYLEIKAGSSGRPNQALEVQNFERLAPILMQIPGVPPKFMAEEAIRRLDDKIDLQEAIVEGAPSITAMNGAKGMSPGGGLEPGAQGPQGANNAPKPPSPSSQAPGPRAPDQAGAPPVAG